MFRKMRRAERELPEGQAKEILENGSYGVLALAGDGGYPYTVPLNYVFDDGAIYFHCAAEGHKIDAIRGYDRASFCVIEADEVDEAAYSTRYRSAIAFGRVRLVEDAAEKRRSLQALCDRFCPATPEITAQKLEKSLGKVMMVCLTIEHLTGKESNALARERREREQA